MLTPTQTTRVDAALAFASSKADEADALAPGFVSSAWSWVIGASSSADTLRSNAYASRQLLATLTAKADRWRVSPVLVEDVEVADFENAARMSNAAAKETADLLGLGAAARETFTPPGGPGTWPPTAWPSWAKVAAGVVALVVLLVVVVPFLAVRSAGGRR